MTENENWPLPTTPFAVQVEALKRSQGRKGYNWFMEPGLGKTQVALSEFLRLRAGHHIEKMVVVCPNSLKTNWQDEAKACGSGLKFKLWLGKEFSRKEIAEHDAFVFNYEATLSAGGDQAEEILKNCPCILVLDESHRIKNPSSKSTLRLLGNYSKYAFYKRCLTGTPMTNTVMDFWPQLRMAGALNGSNPISFKNRFAQTGGFKGRQIVGVKNEEALMRLVAESGFRATKAEWAAHLPEKLYREPIRIEMPKPLQAHYQSMQEEFIVSLSDEQVITAEMVASQYVKLQQISSGFIKDGDDYHQLVPMISLPKFEVLCEILDSNGCGNSVLGSKTLVFAHFRHTCRELLVCLKEVYGDAAYILGGMSPDETRHQKERFNAKGGPQVMVLQIAAGREGHTLLGHPENPCYNVCFYENNFNLGDRVQAEDRAHRHGQKNNVIYTDFTSSPIETLIIKALQNKKELIGHLLDNKPKLQESQS